MLEQPLLAFLGAFSPMHMGFILVVALLLFGNRLPEVARSLGRSLNEFKKGLKDVQDEIQDASDDPPANRLDPPDEKTPAKDPLERDTAGNADPTDPTPETDPVESKTGASDSK